MARLSRLYVPGCSHHIIQRGNNRSACFFDEQDYAFYLQQLKVSAKQYDVAVHSFVLMTNHVHLFVDHVDQGVWIKGSDSLNSAWLGAGLGDAGLTEQILGSGLISGVMSDVSGGNFGEGFLGIPGTVSLTQIAG